MTNAVNSFEPTQSAGVSWPDTAMENSAGLSASALIVRGRVSYRVNLVSGQQPICLIDGRTVEPTHNATMTKLVANARKLFGV
jgi:hypothetical protein